MSQDSITHHMTDDPLAGAVSDAFLQTNQRGADSHRDSAGIDWLKNSIVRKGYPMKSPDSAWSLQWRRFVVDVLIGASTVAVGFALIGALTGVSYTLPLLGRLNMQAQTLQGLVREPPPAMQPAPNEAAISSGVGNASAVGQVHD